MVNEKKKDEVAPETPAEEQRIDDAISAVDELKDTLTSNLANATAEVEELHVEADEAEAKLSAKDEKIKDLEKKLEDATAQAADKEAKLKEIEKARIVSTRVRFLQENRISRSTEENLLKQAEKCAEMSEEEFDAYTSDLLDIKDTILSQFQDAEKEAEKEEELDATVDEIKAADEETAASVEEVDEKLKKILSDEGLLGITDSSPKQTSAEESEEEETSTEEESSEDSEEAAEKEIASEKKDYAALLISCFSDEVTE
ncbi:MAG: hypothetical protein DRQ39_07135 [Gammaproteobacteria bacterium]|nr:MAG: hypothetical protein DRQ39_07135 [Gammaproteobacteria bacterium]